MLIELLLRFVVGGLVVAAFSVVGEVVKPQSFAGIFGAAPSVAIATVGITFVLKPASYVAREGHAMLAGAVALFAYCLLVSWLFTRLKEHPVIKAVAPWSLWFAVAFSLWRIALQ